MNIQTEQTKPHRKRTSIAQEFIVSFTIIISGVKIVYIGRIQMHGKQFKSTKWIWLYLTESLTHGLLINIGVQNKLPDVQPTQTNSES